MRRDVFLAVSGIHGLQHADRVRHLLAETPGVLEVEARLDVAESRLAARVRYEEPALSSEQLRTRLTKAGYRVETNRRRAQLTFTSAIAPVGCVC